MKHLLYDQQPRPLAVTKRTVVPFSTHYTTHKSLWSKLQKRGKLVIFQLHTSVLKHFNNGRAQAPRIRLSDMRPKQFGVRTLAAQLLVRYSRPATGTITRTNLFHERCIAKADHQPCAFAPRRAVLTKISSHKTNSPSPLEVFESGNTPQETGPRIFKNKGDEHGEAMMSQSATESHCYISVGNFPSFTFISQDRQSH
jgi:hypothetical protein